MVEIESNTKSIIALANLFNVTKDVIVSTISEPNIFALLITQKFNTKSMSDNDEIMLFIEGHYNLNGEPKIKKLCDMLLDIKYNEGFYTKVCQKIIATSPRISRDIEEPNHKINVKNGIVDISSIYDKNGNFDIIEMKLESHNSDYNFLYKLDIDFDPKADCPNIKKFLRASVKADDDYLCLQEIFGYLLYPTYKFDKLFIFYGITHSHKTKTTGLMSSFIGSENTSSIKLHKLHERFTACDLYGKKLNICSEISDKTLEDPEIIKDIVGFEPIRADVKMKKPIKFFNRAKIVGTSNKLPGVDTNDDALMGKIILIDFPFDFSNEDSEAIMKTLTTSEEMSGLLNWGIEGLERLIRNNRFTYDHSTTIERWEERLRIQRINPLTAFYESCLNGDVNTFIYTANIYEHYKIYCELSNKISFDEKNFGRHINKFPLIVKKRPGSKGEQQYAYYGINYCDNIINKLIDYIIEKRKIEKSTIPLNKMVSEYFDINKPCN